eukprot:7966543-Alexandrium_andersonii.AAC.1
MSASLVGSEMCIRDRVLWQGVPQSVKDLRPRLHDIEPRKLQAVGLALRQRPPLPASVEQPAHELPRSL